MATKPDQQLVTALKKKLNKKIDLSALPKQEMQAIAKLTVKEIKKSVSKGISPIEGAQRFPAYKNPENYPDKIKKRFPSKRRRPVNLELSGDFLKNLKFKIENKVKKLGKFVEKREIKVGFFDEESINKEKGHRDGANGQPKRPIIPNKKEDFKRRIKNSIVKEFKKIFRKNVAKRK
jgi:hypothetical protein